jgi:crossover junction endodeoxyribonuclease RusA
MTGHVVEFELPWPTSSNAHWRGANGRVYVTGKTLKFRAAAVPVVKDVVRLTGSFRENARLSVVLRFNPPTDARRDIDNFAKEVLDACTAGELWADDSQIDRLLLERAGKCKGGRVTVSAQVVGDTDELELACT